MNESFAEHYVPMHTSGGGFDVTHARKNWRRNIPDKGERIAFLRSQLDDCRSEQNVRMRNNSVKRHHPITAACLEEMLEAEGVSYVETLY